MIETALKNETVHKSQASIFRKQYKRGRVEWVHFLMSHECDSVYSVCIQYLGGHAIGFEPRC